MNWRTTANSSYCQHYPSIKHFEPWVWKTAENNWYHRDGKKVFKVVLKQKCGIFMLSCCPVTLCQTSCNVSLFIIYYYLYSLIAPVPSKMLKSIQSTFPWQLLSTWEENTSAGTVEMLFFETEQVDLRIHGKAHKQGEKTFPSTVSPWSYVNPIPSPPTLKALLFYLCKEKVAQQISETGPSLQSASNSPRFSFSYQPLQRPWYRHLSRYIKSAQPDNWVNQIRGHWLQSLRATRGVTAATPDWV